MRILATILLLLMALGARAINQIDSIVTITNIPTGLSQTLTVNGNTRAWTNLQTSTTFLTNLTSAPLATTNMFAQIGASPFAGGIDETWFSPTGIVLHGTIGGAMTVTSAGGWASIAFTTNPVTPASAFRVPIEIETSTNRTNFASLALKAISDYSTQAFATNSASVSNLIQKGAGVLQTVAAPVQFNALTNSIVQSLKMRRASPASYILMENAGATTNFISLNDDTTLGIFGGIPTSPTTWTNLTPDPSSVLNFFSLSRLFPIMDNAIGSGTTNLFTAGIIFSNNAPVFASSLLSSNGATLKGAANPLTLTNASGAFSGLTVTNLQVLGGNSSNTTMDASTIIGSNYVAGRFAFKAGTYGSLINGNVAAIPLGTNQVVELSGGTTVSQIAGFAATGDGDERLLRISGAVTNWIVNEANSPFSTDPTAANRIVTGSGGDIALTNQPSFIRIRYRGTSSRWEVTSFTR